MNFAVFSETASGVDLCLFDSMSGAAEQMRILMTEQTDQVWHVAIPGLQPGQPYGYRVSGPYEPERGTRFNSSKLLIDPYSKAVAGDLIWSDDAFGYPVGNPAGDLVPDYRDDAWCIPRSVVIDTAFDWGRDVSPRTPLHSSIIYEAHVKGFTYRGHAIPDKLRGTYTGLGSRQFPCALGGMEWPLSRFDSAIFGKVTMVLSGRLRIGLAANKDQGSMDIGFCLFLADRPIANSKCQGDGR